MFLLIHSFKIHNVKLKPLQIMFSKFEYDGKLNPTFVEGPFQLPVSSIRAYIAEPILPRLIISILYDIWFG